MLRNRKSKELTTSTMIRISSGVEWILDSEISKAILLVEKTGMFVQAEDCVCELICFVGSRDVSLAEITAYFEIENEEEREALFSIITDLDRQQVIETINETSKIQSNSDSAPMPVKPLREQMPLEACKNQAYPRWSTVALYAYFNIWYRIVILFRNWRPVAQARAASKTPSQIVNAKDLIPFFEIEEIIAAVRTACCLPIVRRTCVPNSLAIHRLLRLRGFSPELVVAGNVIGFEPHIWCQLNGHRIDSGVSDQSLEIFRSIANTNYQKD
ncbi:MAG: lasso peptide biosynthesis B2 protein [Planctomycetota bacterium]